MGAVEIKRLLGANNADNAISTSLVVADGDGSIVERLEYLQQAAAGAVGIPTFPAAAAPANNVSLAEVLRYVAETLLGGAAASQARFASKQHTSPLTTGNIFTYTGAIEILALWGRVTTVIQSQATTIKTGVVNDSLSAYDLGTTVDGNAAAVGTLLSLPAAAGSAHILTANGVINPTQASRIITQCGTSGVIKATYGAASTGAILYGCLWRPLSSDATLIAA
jgi:hypothetical protein